MGKERSKEAGSGCFSHNVIELCAYRRRKTLQPQHHLLYVTDHAQHTELIHSIPALATDTVSGMDNLRSVFVRRNHDLIFIDADITWADPVELIERLTKLHSPPIILLYSGPGQRCNTMLKQAFAAGLHDALFAPLSPDELRESVAVLLKLRRHVR